MSSKKPSDVKNEMLDPTWADTNNPHAAPAMASPIRSRTWANFLTRKRMGLADQSREQEISPSRSREKPRSRATLVLIALGRLARSKGGFAEQFLLRRGLRAPILWRGLDLAAEFGGGMPAPARVVQHAARKRDHIGLARRHDLFGLLRLGDQADRHGGEAGRFLHGLRQRNLISRAERYLLQRRHAAGGGVDPVDAALLQLLGVFDGLPDVPAAIDPVGRRYLDADRLVIRKHRAHGVEHLKRITDAILQAAAMLIGPL